MYKMLNYEVSMNVLHFSRQRGFTIVELLIAVTIIAILASITVTAYNGISQRARNNVRLASVSQAEKAVRLALSVNSTSTVHDTLYISNNWKRACIGIGHTNLDGDGGNTPDCGRYLTDPAYVSETTAFNNLLKASGMLPNMSTYQKVTASYGDVVTGPFLEDMFVDSIKRLVIEYNLEGANEPCKNAPLVYGEEGSRTLTKPASGSEYSSTGGGVTECRFVVADL